MAQIKKGFKAKLSFPFPEENTSTAYNAIADLAKAVNWASTSEVTATCLKPCSRSVNEFNGTDFV
jgi:hypothetical protein